MTASDFVCNLADHTDISIVLACSTGKVAAAAIQGHPSHQEIERMNLKGEKVVVCGAGGFIGGHLVKTLLSNGVEVVRAVDIKPVDEWYQVSEDVENLSLDLKEKDNCLQAAAGVSVVFQLAADMGGMGFIENNKALCMLSVLTNTHMLLAARECGVERFFYSSSACVYNGDKQKNADVVPLKEEDAYPALPEDGYGWEKLFSERMCRHFEEDFGMQTRVARFHNVYGPHGTWDGGREKAPAAICRKVLKAKHSGNHQIEIWGDGKQTRSFMYIDDCTYGTQAILESDIREPINLGSSELVTINQLVDIVEDIAGIRLERKYKLDAPKGVNGRNSDNTLIKKYLGWEPSIRLRDGLEKTYEWIESEMLAKSRTLGCAA
jgi:GDP-D-mannose 3', 5'-epimerase